MGVRVNTLTNLENRPLKTPPRTLHLCYFGVREPLVQTQVLPYLRQLQKSGVDISILTFEPGFHDWSDAEREAVRGELQAQGIRWFGLPYHKRPTLPATLYDILCGAAMAIRIGRRERIDVLHARAHVPAAMASLAKVVIGAKVVFDIRGLMAEEYVDAGVWKNGSLPYRLVKLLEKRLLQSADGFVVLTERIRDSFFGEGARMDRRGAPVEVIPCCVDLSRFQAAAALSRDAIREELGLSDRKVIVYVGALGGWYLTEEMAELLAAAHARDPRVFSLILTQSPPDELCARLDALGVGPEDRLIRKVAPAEIPRYLKAADLAISLIKPCYSKLASSPTKLAEYLASGLPVICNPGIGDVDRVITADRVGVLVEELTREGFQTALDAAEALCREPGLSERCRASAQARFDLNQVGGQRYRRLYERLFRREADSGASGPQSP